MAAGIAIVISDATSRRLIFSTVEVPRLGRCRFIDLHSIARARWLWLALFAVWRGRWQFVSGLNDVIGVIEGLLDGIQFVVVFRLFAHRGQLSRVTRGRGCQP